VVKTIQLDMLLTIGLGLLFSYLAHPHYQRGSAEQSALKTPYFVYGLLYCVIVGDGVALACYLIRPAWMWMYWVDPERLPPALMVYYFGLYPILFTLGFLAVPELEKLRPGLSLKIFFIDLAAAGLFIFLAFGRLWSVGTLQQYLAGQARPMIGGSPLFCPLALVLLGSMVVALPAAAWMGVRFRRGLKSTRLFAAP